MENHHEDPNGKRAMVEELLRGRDMANQLLEVFARDKWHSHLEKEEGSKSVFLFVEDLVHKISCTFTNTLFILNSNSDVSDEVAAPMEEICKSHGILNTKKRTRSYKRKSIAPTSEKESSTLIQDDGHVWRKYGQKMTSNAKYQRSYYRCTHKNDQGCQAIKQVQKIQDNPSLYRTTYYGHHTCTIIPLNPDNILEPFSPSTSSILLSFNNNVQNRQGSPLSPSLLASTKNEPQEVIHDDHSAQNQLSTLENLLLNDYEMSFYYSRNANLLPWTEPLQFENAYEQFGF